MDSRFRGNDGQNSSSDSRVLTSNEQTSKTQNPKPKIQNPHPDIPPPAQKHRDVATHPALRPKRGATRLVREACSEGGNT